MNQLPIPGWARQPILWDHEDFKWPTSDSANITTAVKRMFSTSAAGQPQWQIQGNNAASGSAALNDVFGHNGTYLVQTEPTSGRTVWFGNTAGLGNFTTGVIRPNSVVRWEWWVNVSTVTSVLVAFGVNDDWTTGTAGVGRDASVIQLNTATSGNWTAVTNNSQLTAGPAAAANTWVKLSAQFRNMNYASNTGEIDYYVDEVLLASHTIVPTSTLILGGYVSTLSAAVRSIMVDRASLWVDGETMTG